ncbi:MAG: S9 family peptidase [Candidatus Dormibacterales bacterium]
MVEEALVPEDLYRFRWVSHVRLDHAGQRVAYCVSWAEEHLRDTRSQIYLQDLTPGSEAEELAGGDRDSAPDWSSAGEIAFVRKVGPITQVHAAAPGGAVRQLTFLPEGASSPRFSPGGRLVAFLGTVVGDPGAVVDDPRPSEDEDQSRRPPVARVVRSLNYKFDGSGYFDGRNQHLFVVPAGGGEARQLTDGPWSVEAFSWSPASDALAVVADAEPDADLRLESDLYAVSLDGGRRTVAGGMYMAAPAWSPDGSQIAFAAPAGKEPGRLDRVWVVPAAGGEPRCLTADLDLGVGDALVSDMRAAHTYELAWSGDRVHFLASGPGRSGVWSVGPGGDAREEAGGPREVFDHDVRAGVVALGAADPTCPGDVFALAGGVETRLTDLNPWLRARRLALPEPVSFSAPDGLPVEGWLMKPPGFDPARRHPLVLQVHGGPHAEYGWTFFHEFQVLAGMGLVVLHVNPRGSGGYGEDFMRAVSRDWGGLDFGDLMACLDQTVAMGFVDESRMGIAGGSYGGYMTNWAIGHTDRFAAAVAMRSLSNLVSEYAQHDIVLWGRLEMGPPPWSDPQELWRRSPIRYVERIRTPLLLLHGEMDLRCAVSQAEEMFGALRLLGREVEMVRFPGESHDLSRSGRPDRRVERLRRIQDWFGGRLCRMDEAVDASAGGGREGPRGVIR